MTAYLPIDAKAHALALYETATVTHKRQDWRLCAHALAAVLRAERVEPVTMAVPALPAPIIRPPAPARAAKVSGYEMTGQSLTRALRIIGRVIHVRQMIPVCSAVLLEARGDVLTITGNDLDNEVSATVAAPGVGEWSAVIPHKALAALLAKTKGEVRMVGTLGEEKSRRVEGELIKYRDSRLEVFSGASSANFEGLCPDDFPRAKYAARAVAVPIGGEALARMLEFVSPAMSSEETRYYLNGAYIHTYQGALAMVATDGHRLNLIEAPASKGWTMNAGHIIPRAAVVIMRDMLKAGGEKILFGVAESHLVMTCGAVSFKGKMIDGAFPDYRRVIPQARARPAFTMGRAALSDAVARVASMSSVKHPVLKFTFDGYALIISVTTPGGATAAETVSCTGHGEPVAVGFGAYYVLDACRALDGDTVSIEPGKSPADPARFMSPGHDDRLCVLMPART